MSTHVPTPFTRPQGPGVGTVLGIVGIIVLALASFLVILILAAEVGNPVSVALSGVMALVPLAFVIWAVLAIDRWEPEPRIAMWFAVLWGGVAAVLLTLLLNALVLEPAIVPWLPSEDAYLFYATVIQAPFTEELWKAVPVLIMYWGFRRHFDGPVDGVVFAALSAAGFAYTENILYFGRVTEETGDASFVFFVRGIMSPLTHALFTAAGTGIMMGLAARLRSRAWGLLAFPVGWGISMLLHALWNSADWWVPGGITGFFIFYAVVQVPLCVAIALLIWLLLRQEVRITRLRLLDYAQAGWFTQEEVDRLATTDGRATLMGWARRRKLTRLMRDYILTATKLANHRQQALLGRNRVRAVADEAGLLATLVRHRRAMATAALGQPAVVHPGAAMHLRQPDQQVQRFGGYPSR